MTPIANNKSVAGVLSGKIEGFCCSLTLLFLKYYKVYREENECCLLSSSRTVAILNLMGFFIVSISKAFRFAQISYGALA